jgi:hypothetical protein
MTKNSTCVWCQGTFEGLCPTCLSSNDFELDFRGTGKASQSRFAIPFYTISSARYEKVEQQLQAFSMPISKIIEQNTIEDMNRMFDANFIKSLRMVQRVSNIRLR